MTDKTGIFDGANTDKAVSSSFHLDTAAIPQTTQFAEGNQDELRDLGLRAYDQTQVEQSVLNQIDEAVRKNEWTQRVKFANREIIALNKKLQAKQEEIRSCKLESKREQLQDEISTLRRNVVDAQKLLTKLLSSDISSFPTVKQENGADNITASTSQASTERVLQTASTSASRESDAFVGNAGVGNIFQKISETETERERLIRLGEITPMDATNTTSSANQRLVGSSSSSFEDRRRQVASTSGANEFSGKVKSEPESDSEGQISDTSSDSNYSPSEANDADSDTKADVKLKFKSQPSTSLAKSEGKRQSRDTGASANRRSKKPKRENTEEDENEVARFDRLIGEAGVNEEESDCESEDAGEKEVKKRGDLSRLDDSDDTVYETRLRDYRRRCIVERELFKQSADADSEMRTDSDIDFVALDNGLRVPRAIWSRLFKYQQTGVRWLTQLHVKRCGGVVGDEMGLGKTIQIAAFLATLRCSNQFRSEIRSPSNAPAPSSSHSDRKQSTSNKKAPVWCSQTSSDVRYIMDEGGDLSAQMTLKREFEEYGSILGPVLIVCPATMLFQWLSELHSWYPPFRVLILHATSPNRARLNDRALIRFAATKHCILLTTYQTLRVRQHELLSFKWHYVILDEGQQIRNPDTQISSVCKQFATPHRIVLSGCPIQNNLRELWSLFDFVFPGLLGLLPDFEQHLAVPIVQGGYANATQVEVEAAYKCACILRDTISPYLMRRVKADVNISVQLPNKTEQVLFCRLTPEQRSAYKRLLSAPICQQVVFGDTLTQADRRKQGIPMGGYNEGQLFAMLVKLRKVCNHSDLLKLCETAEDEDGNRIAAWKQPDFGDWQRSGKMIVLHNLLRIWHKQEHRALVFAQTRQVLDIIEKYVRLLGYRYLRMDGTTAIGRRQALVTEYNGDRGIFLFLLTTRVGGVGVNLIGANRVVLFEPDWNPTTDAQARERVWRIGQTREVSVYRLLTSGTIEEKIYHRQIFKQFLTNRILADPRQRRFFKTNGLKELFTLLDDEDDDDVGSANPSSSLSSSKAKKERRNETGLIFAGTDSEIDLKRIKREVEVNASRERDAEEERKAKVRELARQLNQKFTESYLNKQPGSSESAPSTSRQAAASNSNSVSRPDKNHDEKRSKLKVKVDGERVGNVAKKSTWRGVGSHGKDTKSGKGSKDQADTKPGGSDDDFVLSALLKSSKTKNVLHSALRHDRIVDVDGDMNADEMLIQRAAEKVARSAVEALERSRTLYPHLHSPPRLRAPSSSAAAAAGPKPRFGMKKNLALLPNDSNSSVAQTSATASNSREDPSKPKQLSSADILKEIRDRDSLRPPKSKIDSEGGTSRPVPQRDAEFYAALLNDVRDFIATQAPSTSGSLLGGQASTPTIVERFRDRVGQSPDDLEIFKHMLKRICSFHRMPDGTGFWRLKPDFE